jgi:hypothetical protein
MIVDPVLVAPEPVAWMEHRRMLVGDARKLVEPAAGKRPNRSKCGSSFAKS